MAEDKDMVAEEAKPSNMPMILVGVITLVLGAVGGLFASNMMSGESDTEEATESATETVAAEGTTGSGTVSIADANTVVTPLGDFSVNLKEAATMRILQMSISVECETSVEATITEKTPEIRNAILMFTSEYTVNSLTGLEGKMDLRDEIQLRINAIIKPHRVERVYFTKFIIGK
jgi:flagellar FliL protein